MGMVRFDPAGFVRKGALYVIEGEGSFSKLSRFQWQSSTELQSGALHGQLSNPLRNLVVEIRRDF